MVICLIDLLTYPYKGFENFLILSMNVISPLSRPSRVILVVPRGCLKKDYSPVHISLNKAFLKNLKKPSIVQK